MALSAAGTVGTDAAGTVGTDAAGTSESETDAATFVFVFFTTVFIQSFSKSDIFVSGI